MDVNATLEQIRSILKARKTKSLDDFDMAMLADLIEELDQWCSRSGFIPDAWKV